MFVTVPAWETQSSAWARAFFALTVSRCDDYIRGFTGYSEDFRHLRQCYDICDRQKIETFGSEVWRDIREGVLAHGGSSSSFESGMPMQTQTLQYKH